jgi:hypothetical protein
MEASRGGAGPPEEVAMSPSRSLPIVLTAVALALTTPVPAAAAGPDTWKEPATGEVFPVTVTAPGGTAPLALTGGGVRTKMVFKVYAFGFYVDPAAAATGLAAWAGKPADALRQDKGFYAALVEFPGDKLAAMKFVRNLEGAQIGDALDAAVARTLPSTDPARAQFRALWKDPIKKGDESWIVIRSGGEVAVVRGGKVVGTVDSKPLGKALLLAWFGPEPVSESIREGAVERIPHLLAGK